MVAWDNIKYLFQIPLSWFKQISNRVFKAYGTNFIVVKEGDDGAMQIDVDDDSFAAAVQRVAGSSSGGVTASKKVVTGVTWTGTQLKYQSETWAFDDGKLTTVTSNNDTVIDTTVTFTGT